MLRKHDVGDISIILLFFTSLVFLFQYINAVLPFYVFSMLTILWAILIGYMVYKRRKLENRLYNYLDSINDESDLA